MAIISLEDLQKYTEKYAEDTSQQEYYIDSAIDIIRNYLKYDPEIKFNREFINGSGTNGIQLKSKPVWVVYSVTDEKTGKEIFTADPEKETQDYYISDEFVEFKDAAIPENKVLVKYVSGCGYIDARMNTAGWGDAGTTQWDGIIRCGDSGSELEDVISGGFAGTAFKDFGFIDFPLPVIIKQTALRIAALLQTEGDNNIGVTGKSMGDSGSRTFVNYVNFEKYLSPISRYKLLVI
jgi:hypothetical protein